MSPATLATFRHGLLGSLLLAVAALPAGFSQAGTPAKPAPLTLQEQGSFAVGGMVLKNPGTFDPLKPTPAGQTFHGDHACAYYQIPVNPRPLPLVFLHGAGIRGNTHFLFSDLNNLEIASQMSAFLQMKKLD